MIKHVMALSLLAGGLEFCPDGWDNVPADDGGGTQGLPDLDELPHIEDGNPCWTAANADYMDLHTIWLVNESLGPDNDWDLNYVVVPGVNAQTVWWGANLDGSPGWDIDWSGPSWLLADSVKTPINTVEYQEFLEIAVVWSIFRDDDALYSGGDDTGGWRFTMKDNSETTIHIPMFPVGTVGIDGMVAAAILPLDNASHHGFKFSNPDGGRISGLVSEEYDAIPAEASPINFPTPWRSHYPTVTDDAPRLIWQPAGGVCLFTNADPPGVDDGPL